MTNVYVYICMFKRLCKRLRPMYMYAYVCLKDSVSAYDQCRLDELSVHYIAGIALLVERPTEKPGAILTRVRVPGAARDFFLPESATSADSLTVSLQPPCAIGCISTNFCARVKQFQTVHCLDTQKHCTLWWEWVALLLRLLCGR